MGLIAIIDYGSGNLKSVYNALKNIRGKNTIVVSSSAKEIKISTLDNSSGIRKCLNQQIRDSVLLTTNPCLERPTNPLPPRRTSVTH